MFTSDEGIQLCEGCFSPIDNEPCSVCGFEKSQSTADRAVLTTGTVLNNRYRVGKPLGKGGFGITYLAYDLKLECKVAVKEYYPNGLATRDIGSITVVPTSEESKATFETGADKFYDEAKRVAKFNGHSNIVNVTDFFRENDTAYFVMGYLNGVTLKNQLKKDLLTSEQAVYVANQVSNALIAAHGVNILHRDISPDNIMLCNDGSVKLLDFGAARQVLIEGSQNLSVIMKKGFTPLEQHLTKGKQGPWTDIYSLGATLYYCLTGQLLENPYDRHEDDSEYLNSNHGINEQLWQVIKKATALNIADRYQNIQEFRAALSAVQLVPEDVFGNKQAVIEASAYTGEKISSADFSSSVESIDATAPAREVQPIDATAPAREVQPIEATAPAREVQPIEATAPAQEVQPKSADDKKKAKKKEEKPVEKAKKSPQPKAESEENPPKPKNKKTGVIIGIVAAIAVIIGGAVAIPTLFNKPDVDPDTPSVTTSTGGTESVDDKLLKLYNVTEENGGITINNYFGDEEIVEIPEEIKGLPVKKINDSAFARKDFIKSLVIPSTVKEIGYAAFSGCPNLVSVVMNDGVEKIGPFAFNNCTSIGRMTLPESVTTIGESAFANCSSLWYVNIPDKVDTISKKLIYNCDSIKEISLPASIKKVEEYAFSDCEKLEKVSAPSSAAVDSTALFNSNNAQITYTGSKVSVVTTKTAANEIPAENAVQIGKKTVDKNMTGTLSLMYMSLTDEDIKVLSEFKNVTEIYLDGNSLTDLSPLAGLTQLKKLTFHKNSVTSLDFAENLTNLTVLNFEKNKITSLAPLSKHTKLEEMWCNENNIYDLSPIKNCVNMRGIAFGNSSISTLEPLKNMKNLEDILFENCKITSVEPLRGFKKLKMVGLNNNFISDATPLNSSKIEQLWIANNKLNGDYDAIQGLKIATELDISYNGFSGQKFKDFAVGMSCDNDGFIYYF